MTLHSQHKPPSNQSNELPPLASLPVVVAISGGSGALYGQRLLQVLMKLRVPVHLSISRAGAMVIQHELGLELDLQSPDLSRFLDLDKESVSDCQYFASEDFMAPMASGSFPTAGMVVCPCSGASLSAIARGASQNLIQRAAEVHLKENRRLVLVPRETPLSLPTIENMLLAKKAGATILPASPGMYHGAQSMSDLIDFIVARILDQLGIDNDLIQRWAPKT